MLLLALIASTPSRIAKDALLIPFGVALSSTVFHIIYVLAFACRYGYNQQTDTPTFADRSASSVSFQEIRVRVKGHGGWPIYAFAVGRLIGCILLFALSDPSILRVGAEINASQSASLLRIPPIGRPDRLLSEEPLSKLAPVISTQTISGRSDSGPPRAALRA